MSPVTTQSINPESFWDSAFPNGMALRAATGCVPFPSHPTSSQTHFGTWTPALMLLFISFGRRLSIDDVRPP